MNMGRSLNEVGWVWTDEMGWDKRDEIGWDGIRLDGMRWNKVDVVIVNLLNIPHALNRETTQPNTYILQDW